MSTHRDSKDSPHCDGCSDEAPTGGRYNRPGEAALTYRAGTHATFVGSALAQLARTTVPVGGAPLSALHTRVKEDPTIALLDAWAVVGDVLTFYQERIANEGFLRTAVERRSVLELARAVGYELSPGVAAGTHLAFNISTEGAIKQVALPAGIKVQSVPGPDQLPQIFETTQTIVARPEWNDLRPRRLQPQRLVLDEQLCFKGLDDGNVAASRLYFHGTATNLRAGDLLLIVDGTKTRTVTVKDVTPDFEFNPETRRRGPPPGRTVVNLNETSASPLPSLPAPADPPPAVTGVVTTTLRALDLAYVQTEILPNVWTEEALRSLIAVQGWNADDLLTLVETARAAAVAPLAEVYAFRQRLGIFGATAPSYASIAAAREAAAAAVREAAPLRKAPHEAIIGINEINEMEMFQQYGSPAPDWDANSGRTVWQDSAGYYHSNGVDLYLERPVNELVPGGWIVLRAANSLTSAAFRVHKAFEAARTDFAITGKCTGLVLRTAGGGPLNDRSSTFRFRTTTVHAQSEALRLDELPVEGVLDRGTTHGRLWLDRMVLGLTPGHLVAITGVEADAAGQATGVTRTEVVTIQTVMHKGGYTALYLVESLRHRYVMSTVTLNANLAPATHGETVVGEILGSGDATQSVQRFTLKRPPLTHVATPAGGGAASTLAVRVGEVLWDEARSLHGLDSRSRSYAVRLDDDGRATVIFGGSAARLPTGRDNVVATYRSGLGPDGEVAAGSLTSLLTRPAGLMGVTNPLPATGAAPPETLDAARDNAPLVARTLGRVVSLRDFEDFARSFAGIGKAEARAVWTGRATVVHLTVASATGGAVEPPSLLHTNLVKALRDASDGSVAPLVQSFRKRLFGVDLTLWVDRHHDLAATRAAVDRALRDAFSFARRALGQAVTGAETLAIAHRTPGVVAAHVNALGFADGQAQPALTGFGLALPAARAGWSADDDDIRPAELLLLHPTGLTLNAQVVT